MRKTFRRIGRMLVRRPTFGGLTVALIFWWRSLYPSLLPRTWLVQAAVSAVCIGVGYAFGTLLSAIGHRVLRRYGRLPSVRARRIAWWVLAGVGAVALGMGIILWPQWQNDQRALVTMDDVAPGAIVLALLLTVPLTLLLGVIGRLIGGFVRALSRWNRRHLPRAIAAPVTVVLVIALVVVVSRDVVFAQFTSWANSTFGLVDKGTNEGTVQPASPTVSGSPESLVDWDTLGVQGREFVAHATSQDDLRAFRGDDDVTEPVRVYVGLRSADTVDERAELAVEELERTGAFDREVLVVATATGTGWIDPDASEAIEQMYGGDTAIVSIQYSYLPSWISFVTDLDTAADAGSHLFNAVSEHWSQLPEDDRPKLIVFGLSLGSFGAEAPFAGIDGDSSIANIVGRTDGALFVGATHNNPILRQLTDDRDPGSPVWAPVFDGGASVRFTTRDPDNPLDTSDWDTPRVLYVQHPSDPVTYWSFDSFWRPSAWMEHPRGYDVTDDGEWFPFVTGAQGVFDLMAGFGAPPGFGHDYRLDYVDSWAQVVPPDGWTDTDTKALEQFLFDQD